jgi:colanic acid/amylovoran biosynthesis glycosyltransferase
MRIAYLVNQYPKVSHSFIRREILAVERQGFNITRIALRGWDDQVMDPEDETERARTRYVLRDGASALLMAVVRMLCARPTRLIRALGLTLSMSRRADRPLPIHLVYLAEACRVVFWLRESGVQHVHAHFGTNSAEIAMLAHALGGPSWSFTVHGPEEFDRAAFIGLAEKIRKCTFAVAVSSYGRSQLYRLVEQRQWPKVHVVHCGLDRAFFDAPSCPPPMARRLVCVGRLCEQKGQRLLVEAVRLLVDEGVKLTLVLAGDGELRGEIHSQIVRHKLEEVIRITGWISGAQVRDEILAAQALVLPSLAEGLPVALMEAMALCRPVISTFIAGIPELVRSGEHGWLIPAGDIKALAEAMRACLATPTATLTRMGATARDRVLARHSVDVEAAKMARLYLKSFECHSSIANRS